MCRRVMLTVGMVVLAIALMGLLVSGISFLAGLTDPSSPHHSKLSAAAASNDTNAVRKLLKDGHSASDGLKYGPGGALAELPPLFLAAYQGNPEMVRMLLQSGAEASEPLKLCRGYLATAAPLVAAFMMDDMITANLLIESRASMHSGLKVGPGGVVVTGSPLSALLAAPSLMRDVDPLTTILEKGADPSWGNTFGPFKMVSFSPLYAASYAGNVAAVARLLDAGADPMDGLTVGGVLSLRTPLQAAEDYWSEMHYMAKTLRAKNFKDVAFRLNQSIAARQEQASRSDL